MTNIKTITTINITNNAAITVMSNSLVPIDVLLVAVDVEGDITENKVK